MPSSDSTFVLVATYTDKEMAKYDYQKVKDAHGGWWGIAARIRQEAINEM